MESFTCLDIEALFAFDLILGLAMAVILLVTRLGLGPAARRVDLWLAGTLLLLAGRVAAQFLPLPRESAGLVAVPPILAGLYWQSAGMRVLRTGREQVRRTVAGSCVVAVLAALACGLQGERVLPLLFAGATLLLARDALGLCRRFWGGRLLAAAALVLLAFNVAHAVRAPAAPALALRRGLQLEMVWALFSTAGFLQCVYQDIRDRLAAAAVTDALTGALNRSGLMPLLQRDIEHARRGGPLSIALCDLDHFKQINDRHGHLAGDQVLRRFVAQVRGCLRAGDLVGRWGGEEFLLVLPQATLEEAAAIAQRVRAAIAASEAAPAFTFSAGIAGTGEHGVRHDLEQLLAVADRRLYVAKRTRDAVVWLDEVRAAADAREPAARTRLMAAD